MTIPIKLRPEGLGEFELNDVVPIEHGGTGAISLQNAQDVLGISSKLESSEYIQHFKGVFASASALNSALPTALDGDYAHIDTGVDFDRLVAIWDSSDNKWVIKEAKVIANTDEVPEGSQNRYFKEQRVLDSLLNGLIAGTSTEILATDNLITALQKLQAQIKKNQVEWVTVDKVGTFGTAFFPYVTIGGKTIFLEFAKINGMLWIRGGITIGPELVGSAYPLITLNTEYKIKKFWLGREHGTNSQFQPLNMYTDNTGSFLFIESSKNVFDNTDASTAAQYIYSKNSLNLGSVWRIPPTCIGILVNP